MCQTATPRFNEERVSLRLAVKAHPSEKNRLVGVRECPSPWHHLR